MKLMKKWKERKRRWEEKKKESLERMVIVENKVENLLKRWGEGVREEDSLEEKMVEKKLKEVRQKLEKLESKQLEEVNVEKMNRLDRLLETQERRERRKNIIIRGLGTGERIKEEVEALLGRELKIEGKLE